MRECANLTQPGTTEWPGVKPPDVALGAAEKVMAAYPSLRDQVGSFVKEK